MYVCICMLIKEKNQKQPGKRQWASSRKEQSIQQHPNFRRNIVIKALARGLTVKKPLPSLDLNDWVKELGIKKLEEYSQEIIFQKLLERKNVE